MARKPRYVNVRYYVIQLAASKCSSLTQLLLIEQILAHSTSGPAVGKDQTEWTNPITVRTWARILNCEERFVQVVIRDALTRRLIQRDPPQDSDSPRAGYRYRVTDEKAWKAAPDYKAAPKKEKEPEPEPEPEREPEPDRAPAAPRRSVDPGKHVQIRFEEPAEAVEYVNDLPFPIETTAAGTQNGIPKVHVSAPLRYMEVLKNLVFRFSGGVHDNAPQTGPGGVHDNAPPPALEVPFAELRYLCDTEAQTGRIRGVITDADWVEVVEALGDTPEKFAAAIFQDKLELKRQGRKLVEKSLLKLFAADAKIEWKKAPAVSSRQEAAERLTPEQLRECQIGIIANAVVIVEHWKEPHHEFEEIIRTAAAEDLTVARQRAQLQEGMVKQPG